jgi:hypothetical protein
MRKRDRQLAVAVVVLGAALPLLSCSDNNTPLEPTPSPTPSPSPTASPTPTPVPASPSPSPSNPPEGTTEPAVYATAGVHSYLRNGNLVRSGASSYKPGDTIYLNCTPRDKDGNKTTNHGPIKTWGIFSFDLVAGNPNAGDYYYTDTNSFNPDLHINKTVSKTGTIKAFCTVANLPRSANHNMVIKK